MITIFARALSRLLALGLFGATPVWAGPLSWPPPPLSHPVTIAIGAGAFSRAEPGDVDCVLAWPAGKHVGPVEIIGCRNLISIGGWTTLPRTSDLSNSAPSRGLYLKGLTGVAHIEGLLIDGSGGGMSDGVDIAAPQAVVQIENVRIEGIYGYFDQFHADCLQPFGGVRALRVDRLTCYTGYQGLSVGPASQTPRPWSADFRRVNIVSTGPLIHGAHNSGGFLYWPCNGFACANVARTRLTEVYLQPRPGASFASTVFSTLGAIAHPAALVAGTPAAISFPGLPIDGHVSQGPPPGGDFVPTGVAGPAYVSPGYAPAP